MQQTPGNTPLNKNIPYYPALDGIRGLAIILVILTHNFGYTTYFQFGWMGVDIFFTLSGFLITQIIMKTVHEPGFLKKFYLRRMFRIAPVYYGTLVVCLILLPLFPIKNADLTYFTSNQVWIWIYAQNWLFIFKEPYGAKYLLHLWSLAVEEQFYLFWPLIVLLVRKPKKLFFIVLSLLVLTLIGRYFVWTSHIENLNYYHLYTFTRIDGICIGCMLALLLEVNTALVRRYTLPVVLAFAAFNFVFYFINKSSFHSLPYLAILGYTSFALLFGYLIYEASLNQKGILNILFNNRIMRFLGKISYGLYVFHWPIHLFLFPVFEGILLNNLGLPLYLVPKLSSAITIIIAIIVSSLSYKYFENYFLNLKKRYV